MSTKQDKELATKHLRRLEEAQNERIEKMFEDLKDFNMGLLSEIPSRVK